MGDLFYAPRPPDFSHNCGVCSFRARRLRRRRRYDTQYSSALQQPRRSASSDLNAEPCPQRLAYGQADGPTHAVSDAAANRAADGDAHPKPDAKSDSQPNTKPLAEPVHYAFCVFVGAWRRRNLRRDERLRRTVHHKR